jgi:hypothetical protein
MWKRVLSSAALPLVIVGALLACKKSDPAPAASATAEPAPVATPVATPEPVASAEPATSASAEPATTADPAPTTVKTTAKPKPSASAPVASVTPPPSASAPPPSSQASFQSIQRCCAALSAESKKEGPNKSRYATAATTCYGIAQQVKDGKADPAAAKTTIRAQLSRVPVPAACR